MPRKLTPEELEARFERLPAWAKDEILRLRRDAAYYREDAAALRLGAYGSGDTDTVADPYADAAIRLKKGTTIEFTLGEGYDQKIRVRVVDGALDVNGNAGIYVRPSASNALRILGGAL